MAQRPPSRYWVIMHPSSGGDVVGKLDTETNAEIIPDDVANYSDLSIVEVPDRSKLVSKTVDQSTLTQKELDLLYRIYPVR